MSEEKNSSLNEELNENLGDSFKEDSPNLDESLESENSSENDVINELESKLSDITEKYYRANADFENIKKRLEKDKFQAIEYANSSFAKELLPIIDALEEAIKVEVGDNELARQIEDGVERCLDIFLDVFKKNGIEPVLNDGKGDPEFHNIISVIDSKTHEKGDIVQVYQKGYKFKDRLLRPSMVVVAK